MLLLLIFQLTKIICVHIITRLILNPDPHINVHEQYFSELLLPKNSVNSCY